MSISDIPQLGGCCTYRDSDFPHTGGHWTGEMDDKHLFAWDGVMQLDKRSKENDASHACQMVTMDDRPTLRSIEWARELCPLDTVKPASPRWLHAAGVKTTT